MKRVPFDSPYSQGFIRGAVAVPVVHLADPAANLAETLVLVRRAHDECAAIVAFPELGLTGYSCEDLFQQAALLDAADEAVAGVRDASRGLMPVLIVGAPVRADGRLFNAAIVIHDGRILGVVPKSYLPNYREFYEKRQFSAARQAIRDEIELCGDRVPFGTDLLFEARATGNWRLTVSTFTLAVEICEDLWSPIPPATFAALAGATVVANLSASNATIGKGEYRRLLAASQTGRCLSAYLYAAAGPGESTTDLAWDGHGMIWENGRLLAETSRFSRGGELAIADIDIERLLLERQRVTTFADTAADHKDRLRMRRIGFPFAVPQQPLALRRDVDRFPFVPGNPADRDHRCEEAYAIQVQGLEQRLRSSGIGKLVIGISGGLDSTQALIVAARTMDRLGLPRTNILAYTMPGYATSDRTLSNARDLMRVMGVTAGEIDIRPSCDQMLRDLGHAAAEGKPAYDVTFENVQAGERTSHLFRLANMHGALVLGTGDLSELALGWCTYGVGDHMSHYNVNASVPKTLIRHLIGWVASSGEFGRDASHLLNDILSTEISPELVPPPAGAEPTDKPHQRTEDVIGPYELQDFNLYYVSRFGFPPAKIAWLAWSAWRDAAKGVWPPGIPENERHAYSLEDIRHWLAVFLRRFFGSSQFKRSCVPNGPKVGSGGSLSPRGDWRAPSDGSPALWLDVLANYSPEK
ncbi:MAG: Glutamine-dependent NAD(+) synthetase [bacterium ADurb.Bin374]|nr:MAG: Glutamine-dependent NAD(+) synthetase [bacterium ADurb.Bin374]